MLTVGHDYRHYNHANHKLGMSATNDSSIPQIYIRNVICEN